MKAEIVPAGVRRLILVADRAERRSAPARVQRLASRVLAAREPKRLRAATRLAAARTRMSWAPADAPPTPLVPRGAWEEGRNYSDLLPEPPGRRPVSPALHRAVAPAPETGGAPAPAAITPESLGLGPASFEWLFGDPDKALAHPDVTSGPLASLPALSPEQRVARRLARLTARGGSAYGRGAEIREGPANPLDPPAPAETGDRGAEPLTPAGPDSPRPPAAAPSAASDPIGASDPAPAAAAATRAALPPTASPPQAAQPRPGRQRLVSGRRPARTPERELARAADDSVPPPAPTADAPTAPAPAPPEPAQPIPEPTQPIPEPAQPTPEPTPPIPEPAPPMPAAPPATPPATAPATPPATPLPLAAAGTPVLSPATRREAPARSEIARRRPPATNARAAQSVRRPAVQRVPRPIAEPTPTSAPARAAIATPPAARKPSLLRRALAALKPPAPSASVAPTHSEPAPATDFGVPANTYVARAPKSAVARPQVTRSARAPAPSIRTLSRAPSPAPAPVFTSPQPPQWAPAEHSSTQRLVRAPADVPRTSAPADDDPPPTNNPLPIHKPPADPDAAYRDVLLRAREEREQLGRLISHPF
jgi:hypothetical protein